MGQPEPRIDARLKVTGEARYASDMPVNNPAFAFLVTSAIAKGTINEHRPERCQGGARRARDFHAREHRRSEAAQVRRRAAAALRPRSRTSARKSSMTARSSRMVVANTFEAAREAAYKVKVTYDAKRRRAPGSTPPGDAKPTRQEDECRRPAMPRRRSAMRRGASSKRHMRRRPSTTIRSSCSPPPRSGTTTN